MYLKSLQSRWPCLGANSWVLWPGPRACSSARASCRPPEPTSAPTQVLFRAASPLLAICTTRSCQDMPCLAPSIRIRRTRRPSPTSWVLLAVLVFVSVPRLGAEEVKIIGRDLAFDTPAILGAGMTTLVFENPGDV